MPTKTEREIKCRKCKCQISQSDADCFDELCEDCCSEVYEGEANYCESACDM